MTVHAIVPKVPRMLALNHLSTDQAMLAARFPLVSEQITADGLWDHDPTHQDALSALFESTGFQWPGDGWVVSDLYSHLERMIGVALEATSHEED